MSDNSDGGGGGGCTSTSRALKRSLSPDHVSNHERKSKLAKIELQPDNVGKDISDKENYIKHKQFEMVMVKHSISACNDEADQDDGIIIDHLDISSVPLPWYRSHSLWSNMMAKTFDETYKCHSNFLDAHPAITPKMRSVLCDWLIEVSEVYHLHRETYHLAIGYVDQYLCNTNNLPKAKLQLLGITALFIAAKIEEIYPPRISEFAYVTDKAYYEGDILDMELDVMNALNWYINPMTSISWLLTFLQLESEIEMMNNNSSSSTSPSSSNVTPSHNDRCVKKRRLSKSHTPKSSMSSSDSEILKTSILTNVHRTPMFLQTFSLTVRLIDLCSLDLEYSQFPKNVLAATAILACKPNWPVEQITSLNDDDLYICSEWMKPFFDVLYFGQNLKSLPVPASRPSPAVPIDEIYSIQIHNISMDLLENVYKKRPKFIPPATNNRPFRNLVNRLSWLPTPPTSLEKQQHDILVNEEEQLQITEVISV